MLWCMLDISMNRGSGTILHAVVFSKSCVLLRIILNTDRFSPITGLHCLSVLTNELVEAEMLLVG